MGLKPGEIIERQDGIPLLVLVAKWHSYRVSTPTWCVYCINTQEAQALPAYTGKFFGCAPTLAFMLERAVDEWDVILSVIPPAKRDHVLKDLENEANDAATRAAELSEYLSGTRGRWMR